MIHSSTPPLHPPPPKPSYPPIVPRPFSPLIYRISQKNWPAKELKVTSDIGGWKARTHPQTNGIDNYRAGVSCVMKISAKTLGLQSNEPLVIMKCTCKISMNKILLWYIWKIVLHPFSLPTHCLIKFPIPSFGSILGRVLPPIETKGVWTKGTLMKIWNSSLHKKLCQMLHTITHSTFWDIHIPDQFSPYENQCGCYKKLASRSWPVLFKLT